MPVKEIVGLYEAHSTTNNTNATSGGSGSTRARTAGINDTIAHPLLRRDEDSKEKDNVPTTIEGLPNTLQFASVISSAHTTDTPDDNNASHSASSITGGNATPDIRTRTHHPHPRSGPRSALPEAREDTSHEMDVLSPARSGGHRYHEQPHPTSAADGYSDFDAAAGLSQETVSTSSARGSSVHEESTFASSTTTLVQKKAEESTEPQPQPQPQGLAGRGRLQRERLQLLPHVHAHAVLDALPARPPRSGPVAASTVFSRSTAPLALPDLDQHISSLPPAVFPSFPGTVLGHASNSSVDAGASADTRTDINTSGMFPPLDRLEASGKTIDDLEHNTQIPNRWQSRNTYFGAFATTLLSITGSSMLVSLYSLHGLIDTVQIFALILNTIEHRSSDTDAQWHKFLLGTVPNVLALNFATSIRVALGMLIAFMALAGVLLYFFHRFATLCCSSGARTPEGLYLPSYLAMSKRQQWALLLVSFLLNTIYLPLSTMAVHVLVWSDDLWVVPNPYVYPNGTAVAGTPVLPPPGPPEKFRDPLDFCWTTTMQRNEINYSWVVVVFALACFCALTVWFPLMLRRLITTVAPKVDKYTELGTPRTSVDMDLEYQRLLVRDRNPLTFLYHDYRRSWAIYAPLYLLVKLTALLIVAIIDPSNCFFRTLPRAHVQVAQQITLLVAMVAFWVLQCVSAPFLDPVGNAGEWTSRVNYVATAAIALGVALNVKASEALNSWLLYIVYGITYGLSLYFVVIDFSIMQRFVKRIARRIDFSIDIFSPRVDLSRASPHTKRRIWQESITALFLTDPTCAIPASQRMAFAQAREAGTYPPYLLDFQGTPGERHVENLKILREMGSVAYSQGVALIFGPDSGRFNELKGRIQREFVGPDCYWRDTTKPAAPGCKRYFGNAWFVPFPPTVVLQYDDGPIAVLNTISELELYVRQNSSLDIQRRREVRMALRALDGQVVFWPYDYIQPIGSRRPLCCCLPGRRYQAHTAMHYRAGIFRLKRHGSHLFEGINLGSGFDVEITYARRVVVDGSAIGLNDDYDLAAPLARFLALNEELVTAPLTLIEDVLERYREKMKVEEEHKAEVLSYRFLAFVYDRPRDPTGLAESSIEHERDERVRRLMLGNEDVFKIAYERLSVVSTSPIAVWWYIFWDDLWRRNRDTISGLQRYASDFNPHYPTSIAYKPLPRAALEAFLTQRGLLHKKPKWTDFFHAGFLNKMYLRMNDIVYHGSARADIIHLGANNPTEHDMEEVDAQTQARPSTLGTGNGTDEDDESIRARPLYRWEGILDDPLRKTQRHHELFLAKLGVWFGVTPRWRAGIPSMGLALDVRLDNGQYVLMQDDATEAVERY